MGDVCTAATKRNSIWFLENWAEFWIKAENAKQRNSKESNAVTIRKRKKKPPTEGTLASQFRINL